jgi:hypothetical protein
MGEEMKSLLIIVILAAVIYCCYCSIIWNGFSKSNHLSVKKECEDAKTELDTGFKGMQKWQFKLFGVNCHKLL